jgi:hypothetical protein
MTANTIIVGGNLNTQKNPDYSPHYDTISIVDELLKQFLTHQKSGFWANPRESQVFSGRKLTARLYIHHSMPGHTAAVDI